MENAELNQRQVILVLRSIDVRPEYRSMASADLRAEHFRGSPTDIQRSTVTIFLDDKGESCDIKRRNTIDRGPVSVIGRPESFLQLGVERQFWYSPYPNAQGDEMSKNPLIEALEAEVPVHKVRSDISMAYAQGIQHAIAVLKQATSDCLFEYGDDTVALKVLEDAAVIDRYINNDRPNWRAGKYSDGLAIVLDGEFTRKELLAILHFYPKENSDGVSQDV
jgi:hypothetical protein